MVEDIHHTEEAEDQVAKEAMEVREDPEDQVEPGAQEGNQAANNPPKPLSSRAEVMAFSLTLLKVVYLESTFLQHCILWWISRSII